MPPSRFARTFFVPLTLFTVVAFGLRAEAGDPNYVIKVTDANVIQGQVFDVEVQLDNFGNEVQGWSYGVCHVDVLLDLIDVADSPLTSTINNGGPPDFNSTALLDDGFTKGVLICFTGCAALAPGVDQALDVATYQVLAPGPLTTGLSPCSTLGSPVVPVKVVVDGTTINAERQTGVVQIFFGTAPTIHVLRGGQGFSVYDPSNGETSATVSMLIDESELSPGFPTPVTAFDMAVRYDTTLMTLTQISMGSALEALNGGAGPEFFQSTIVPEGFLIEAVISMSGGQPLLAPDPVEVASLEFQANPTPLTFNPFGLTIPLEFDETVDPMGANTLSATASNTLLQLDDGSVRFVPKNRFVRGDANDDGSTDIADVLCVIEHIFSGDDIACEDAADANDDTNINVADVVGMLEFLFLLGPLPAPYPECGFDTTGAGNCLVYNGCP